jgi:geranylgeranyl reductase family protein
MTAPAFDVAVVGAGPAGGSAAYQLARRGYRVVLLEKHAMPRDKACGDGLTHISVALLDQLGVLAELQDKARDVSGVRVVADGWSNDYRHFFKAPHYALVVPRLLLDALICGKAIEQGATLWERSKVIDTIVHDERVCGVRVQRAGSVIDLAAKFVVVADGGASKFSAGSGSDRDERAYTGYAVRGYYTDIASEVRLLQIHVPLVDSDTSRILPGYGWVFPLSDVDANIGVGFMPARSDERRPNLRRLLTAFAESLREKDRRFAQMRQVGKLRGGPLWSGFDPQICVKDGVVFAGDAAGLVDPLTGEGIGAALESGMVAADTIANALSAPDLTYASLSDYAETLQNRYLDRYQTGRQVIRNHLLLWNLLSETQAVRGPLFDALRRAVVGRGPDPIAGIRDASARPFGVRGVLAGAQIAEEISHVEAEVTEILKGGFPFLPEIARSLVDARNCRVRIALAVITAHLGTPATVSLRLAATAIELAFIAHAVHDNVIEECVDGDARETAMRTGRANRFAIMIGAYLLAKSYGLIARLGCDIVQLVSLASRSVCEGKLRELEIGLDITEASYLALLSQRYAIFYSLPCRVAAVLSKLPVTWSDSLSAFGHDLGMALELRRQAESAQSDCPDPSFGPGATGLANRALTLPLVQALASEDGYRLRASLGARHGRGSADDEILSLVGSRSCPARIADWVAFFSRRADTHLAAVPAGPIATMMRDLLPM